MHYHTEFSVTNTSRKNFNGKDINQDRCPEVQEGITTVFMEVIFHTDKYKEDKLIRTGFCCTDNRGLPMILAPVLQELQVR